MRSPAHKRELVVRLGDSNWWITPPRCCLLIVPWNQTFRDLVLDFLLYEICQIEFNTVYCPNYSFIFSPRVDQFTSASAYMGFQTKMALQKVNSCPDRRTPGHLVPQDTSSLVHWTWYGTWYCRPPIVDTRLLGSSRCVITITCMLNLVRHMIQRTLIETKRLRK